MKVFVPFAVLDCPDSGFLSGCDGSVEVLELAVEAHAYFEWIHGATLGGGA